jgi:hypothetical protein
MALADVSVNPSIQPGWNMDFSIRADTYVPISMEIFEVLDPYGFWDAIDRIVAVTSKGEAREDDMMKDAMDYLCQAQIYEHILDIPDDYMDRDHGEDDGH